MKGDEEMNRSEAGVCGWDDKGGREAGVVAWQGFNGEGECLVSNSAAEEQQYGE